MSEVAPGRQTRRPRVLFVTERWTDGNPELGPTNAEHNLFGSLESTGLAAQDRFHFDDYALVHGEPGDAALLARCAEDRPDLAVLSWLVSGPRNPRPETLATLRERWGIPIVAIWWDTVYPPIMEQAERLLPVVDLQVVVDSTTAYTSMTRSPERYLPLWVPQDPRLFCDPGRERDLDVAFAGQLYPERTAGINALRRAGVSVFTAGGQRTAPMDLAEYARVFQRSKLALNFARSYSAYQAKGRIYEATLCGALLLEADNPETAARLEPYTEYVPFSGGEDLVEKARYYLAHDDERRAIAERGKRRAHEDYSAERFWREILDRTLGADGERIGGAQP